VTGHSAFPPTSSGTFETSITRRSHSNVTCVTDALGSRPTWTDIWRSTNTRTFQVGRGIAVRLSWGTGGRRCCGLVSLVLGKPLWKALFLKAEYHQVPNPTASSSCSQRCIYPQCLAVTPARTRGTRLWQALVRCCWRLPFPSP